MNHQRFLLIPAVASFAFGIMGFPNPTTAASFGQQVVDQSKFIAIAVPFNSGNDYKLLIVEQLADTQPCWKADSTTGRVDPLLLNFDFTKICSRSTDANGYSIRRAGQDLWQDYGLRLIKQNNYLALVGVAHRNPTGPKIEIGRTQILQPGFLQITLNPGWQFTKRTYNGQMLGHVYLTQEQPTLPSPAPQEVQVARQPQTLPPIAAGAQPAKAPTPVIPSRRTTRSTLPSPRTQPTDRSPTSQPIATTTGSRSAPKSTKQPELFRRPAASPSTQPSPIEIPVEIGSSPVTTTVPQPRASSDSPLGGSGSIVLPPPPEPQAAAGSVAVSLPILSSSAPVLPGQSPQPAARSRSLPPPPQVPAQATLPSVAAATRYRVLVTTSDPSQQAKIRMLVPGAFRSSYRGQPAMQVGSFEKRTEADNVIQLMTQNGFQPVIESAATQPSQPSASGSGSSSFSTVVPLPPLPVPRATIPMGNPGNTPTIYAAGSAVGSADEPPPPPTPGVFLGHRYRVVVETRDSTQQARVRALIPDAFRSSYQGRSVMQIGSFKGRDEADSVIQVMTQNGFQPVLVTVQ